jgi:hypothetical protein
MGRGNVCVRGKYEGLFYVDYDFFKSKPLDEDGNEIEDGEDFFDQDYLDECISEFKSLMTKASSFTVCDRWHHRDIHVVLENNLFEIAIVDNEWSYAVMLLQKDDSYHYSKNNLQKKHYQNYLNIIKNCLFMQFNKLGIYGGPWTSGTILRPMYYESDCRIPKEERQDGLFYYAVRHGDNGSISPTVCTLERWVMVNHLCDIVTNFEVEELKFTEEEPKPFIKLQKFIDKYNPLLVDEIQFLKAK